METSLFKPSLKQRLKTAFFAATVVLLALYISVFFSEYRDPLEFSIFLETVSRDVMGFLTLSALVWASFAAPTFLFCALLYRRFFLLHSASAVRRWHFVRYGISFALLITVVASFVFVFFFSIMEGKYLFGDGIGSPRILPLKDVLVDGLFLASTMIRGVFPAIVVSGYTTAWYISRAVRSSISTAAPIDDAEKMSDNPAAVR